MKISTILDHIDSGNMALPEFQRGFVWNRDQVRGLFDSLYRRHPIGGLLVWVTGSESATYRGSGKLAKGVVKLLLDGQQRITALHGVMRGRPPKFFDGDTRVFTDLRFHLEEETFSFYQPVKMKGDSLWVDVTELMSQGSDAYGKYVTEWANDPELAPKIGRYAPRLGKLLNISDIELHIEEVTGKDKSIDVVVDIFNRINSGGTKLSKGNLALAKICSVWPEARNTMKTKLREWETAGFSFDLDWLLRSVNTVLTGEAKFQFLHDQSAEDVQKGLERASKHIDTCLNMIAGRLGLDHDRVLFGRFAIPVMVRYLDARREPMNEHERDKMLFWFLQAGMWGRFSGSTETYIDQDLGILEDSGGNIDELLKQLRLWHGNLYVEPSHFDSWSLGARFYPVLYLLTRMGESQDWGTGVPLKKNLLGKMSSLEVHHIFPKSQLYNYEHQEFDRTEVNTLANFCFLTKETNLDIGNRLPNEYFPEIIDKYPTALSSQWIPQDKELWKIENFPEFLKQRRQLLAIEFNNRMEELLHGDLRWIEAPSTSSASEEAEIIEIDVIPDEEDNRLENLNNWINSKGLPHGVFHHELADPETGQQKAVIDVAWPSGLQEELSQPVAILFGNDSSLIATVSQAGFLCFSSIEEFKSYVEEKILAEGNGELQLK